jgi:hypothetical protein
LLSAEPESHFANQAEQGESQPAKDQQIFQDDPGEGAFEHDVPWLACSSDGSFSARCAGSWLKTEIAGPCVDSRDARRRSKFDGRQEQ